MESKQRNLMAQRGYIAAPDAAKRLGYDVTAIYRMISKGYVIGEKVGGRQYVLYSSLVAHVGPGGKKLLEKGDKPANETGAASAAPNPALGAPRPPALKPAS